MERKTNKYTNMYFRFCSWLRGTVVERRSETGELSLLRRWVTTYVGKAIRYKLSQLGQPSLSSF